MTLFYIDIYIKMIIRLCLQGFWAVNVDNKSRFDCAYIIKKEAEAPLKITKILSVIFVPSTMQ
ncbi:MAG: hypothetical protein ACI9TY_001831 [Alphaproteobacteria bacterium]|jgi:hypothetical protein